MWRLIAILFVFSAMLAAQDWQAWVNSAASALQILPRRQMRAGGGVMHEEYLIWKVDPVYPALAREARIHGTVLFFAIIGVDGRIRYLQLVSGHPLLVEAAREAVSQWRYRPMVVGGEVFEVVTQIRVALP